jgi:hypothetical protein
MIRWGNGGLWGSILFCWLLCGYGIAMEDGSDTESVHSHESMSSGSSGSWSSVSGDFDGISRVSCASSGSTGTRSSCSFVESVSSEIENSNVWVPYNIPFHTPLTVAAVRACALAHGLDFSNTILTPSEISDDGLYLFFTRQDQAPFKIKNMSGSLPIGFKTDVPNGPEDLLDWAHCFLNACSEKYARAVDTLYGYFLIDCAFCDPEQWVFPHHIASMFSSKAPNLDINENYDRVRVDASDIYPRYQDVLFNKVCNCKYSTVTCNIFKEEAMRAMAGTYKVHIQICSWWLLSFVFDFIRYMAVDERLHMIHSMKIATHSHPGRIIPDAHGQWDHSPVVVLYVRPFITRPGQDGDDLRNRVMNNLLMALLERYGPNARPASLPYTPRFSCQVSQDNPMIFIAGGEGFVKEAYVDLLTCKYLPRNTVYSPDFCFIKGYEVILHPDVVDYSQRVVWAHRKLPPLKTD